MRCKNGYVIFSFAKRRNCNPDYIKPEKKVLSEIAALNLCIEVQVSGGNYPYIHLYPAAAADTQEFAFLEETKEFFLNRNREFTDFVQKDSPAVGIFDLTGLSFICACEGPFFVAEEFAFEELLRNGRAVDRNKRLIGPWRFIMDRPGDEFLAGAALSGNKHARVALRNGLDQVEYLLHDIAFTYNVFKVVPIFQLGFERDIFNKQPVL